MVLRKVRFHTVKDELFEGKIYLLVNQLFIKLSAEAVLSSFFLFRNFRTVAGQRMQTA